MTKFPHRLWGWLMAAVGAWFVVHVALYVPCLRRIDPTVLRDARVEWIPFFGIQGAVFAILALLLFCVRSPRAGRLLGGYLALSTIALIGASQDMVFCVKFVLFLAWWGCAVLAMRQLLGRLVGKRFATWGIAIAAVYAATIPLGLGVGVLHLLTPWPVGALAVATALPGILLCKRQLPTIARRTLLRLDRVSIFDLLMIQIVWINLAIVFVAASTSPVLSDAPRVHLPYMHQIVADHALSYQYPCWHRLQLMAVDVVCAMFLCVGGDAAAAWFSWSALVGLVWLIAEEVHRRSHSFRQGVITAAAVLSCPLLLRVASSFQIDHVLTLLCTAGILVMFRTLRPVSLRGIILSAALIGAMVDTKYTGLVFAVVWGGYLATALYCRCDRLVALRWTAIAAIVMTAVASPWYIYVYVGTGNPFFPYLNDWFHSPHWVDGLSTREIFARYFALRPGVVGILSFPWVAVYETRSLVEGLHGYMGFLILALVPFWFVAYRRNAAAYLDMVIVGMLMIAGIVCYTPYARYWMPACPLLMASCVLAAGSVIGSAAWRPRTQWMQGAIAVAVCVVLLLPLPFIHLYLPPAWDEYTKRVGIEERLGRRFPVYATVQELNQFLKPDEGVICTDTEGVFLVNGRAYSFPFRWTEKSYSVRLVYRINDVKDFEEFRRRFKIRYWLVDHYPAMRVPCDDKDGILEKYWTDAKIVAASGNSAVYDLTIQDNVAQGALVKESWPGSDEDDAAIWLPQRPSEGWNVSERSASVGTKDGDSSRAWQASRPLPMDEPGKMCKVELGLLSQRQAISTVEIHWLEKNGKVLSRARSMVRGNGEYRVDCYSKIPEGAVSGWLILKNDVGTPLGVKQVRISFWRPAITHRTKTQDPPRLERQASSSEDRSSTMGDRYDTD